MKILRDNLSAKRVMFYGALGSVVLASLFALKLNQGSDLAEPETVTVEQEHVHSATCGCAQQRGISSQGKSDELTQRVREAEVRASGFMDWLEEWKAGAEVELSDGVALAKERKQAMLTLMTDSPEQALEHALSWSQYKALPAEIRAHTEAPFSDRGDFFVHPTCGLLDGSEGGFAPDSHEVEVSGRIYKSTVFGRRGGLSSKQAAPLQGIYLDDRAVVRSAPLQRLSAEDLEAIEGDFAVARGDRNRSFLTGKALSGAPVVALGGGMLFYFSSAEELSNVNSTLEKLDQLPGPHSGAQSIFLQAAGAEAGEPGSQLLEKIEADARLLASTWTETKKKVFFIRIDFSDNTGESVSQAALANALNTHTSDVIRELSYGKTWLEAEVSAMVVRMPDPTTTYLPSNNSTLYNAAKEAFDDLNTGIDLNAYDIVGVHFKSIGMQSGGLTYGGLAGGGRQWLQGTINTELVVHEFGHNYGLGHASFWETTDGSVVGDGSTDEYGNPFDIMGGGPAPEGHFHPQAKAKLNWLESTEWVDATNLGSATHRLYRCDHNGTTGVRGIRVTKAADEHYWIGYRRARKEISYLNAGVVLNWVRPGTSRGWLLDTTPGSVDTMVDSALLVGRTYSDTEANVHITPIAQGGESPQEWVDVVVNVGQFSGNSAPTGNLAGPTTVEARSEVVFTVAASDVDGDSLSYSWDLGDGVIVNNQDELTYSWALGGTYTVAVTISDMKGGSVTKTQEVTVSDPLNAWTLSTVGESGSMYDVDYVNGRYFVSANQYVYFSLDGSSWSRQSIGANFREADIAYGNGKYVCTGRDYDFAAQSWVGVALSSKDGKHWTKVELPTTEPINDVAYGGGRFVAVLDGGKTLYSTDGETWLVGGSAGSANLWALSYGNGEFLSVTGNKVYASTNGEFWVDRSASTGLASWQSFRDIIYHEGVFYAGGWFSGMRYSADNGMTWSAAVMPSGKSHDVRAIAAGDDVFVALADRRSTPNGVVLLVSADGRTWKEAELSNLTLSNSMAFANGEFISAYGSQGGLQRSGKLFSGNSAPVVAITGDSAVAAREVTSFSATASDVDGDSLTLVWDFQDGGDLLSGESVYRRFAVGGNFSVKLTAIDGKGGVTTDTLNVTVSDPMTNWTARNSETTANLLAVTSLGNTLVAVGSDRGTYRSSSDGQLWVGGQIGINITLDSVTSNGTDLVVACGRDYNFSIPGWVGVIYTSPDGVSWTRRHYAGAELKSVQYAGGVFLAVGNSGSILRSTDGVSWLSVASGVTTNLHSISHSGTGWLIVGANGSSQGATILKSDDSLTWENTSASAGTSQGFFHSAYLNDRFFASGFHTRLRYSLDSGSSFVDAGAGNLRMAAMAYGNGVYFAGGLDYSNSSVEVNRISVDGVNWSGLATPTSVDRNAAIFYNNTFITVGDSGEIWQSDVINPATGWVKWQAEKFPELPSLSGSDDDFDGDGVANLLEYIMGSDPHSATSYNLPHWREEEGHLTLSLDKVPSTSGYSLIMESSTDLEVWTNEGITIVTDDENMLKVRFSDMQSDKRFMRVKAAVQP